jgi:predicted RNA-binding Zn-ribbon protein involved in translation (DUF1610 family)
MAEEEQKELYQPSLDVYRRPLQTDKTAIKAGDKYLCPHCKAEVPVKHDCPACGEEIDWTKI